MAKDSYELWQNLIWMHANNENNSYYKFFYQKNDVEQIIEKDFKQLCTVSTRRLFKRFLSLFEFDFKLQNHQNF